MKRHNDEMQEGLRVCTAMIFSPSVSLRQRTRKDLARTPQQYVLQRTSKHLPALPAIRRTLRRGSALVGTLRTCIARKFISRLTVVDHVV